MGMGYQPDGPHYDVDNNGTIITIGQPGPRANRDEINRYKGARFGNDAGAASNESLRIISEKQNKSISELQKTYEQRLADVTSRENTYNSLASQIAGLTGTGLQDRLNAGQQAVQPVNTQAVQALTGGGYANSPLANKLNFQVSDQQILDDYNNTKVNRLKNIADQANVQIAGIQQRLTSAQQLLSQLPSNDPRYTASKVYVDQLNADLKSVTEAANSANDQIKNFKPLAVGSPEAASEITSFREYLQLPEERATQQLRQIDPKSYETAVALGQRYRQMATAPIGETKSAQTEQLRSNLEQEAINQLALGSQLGAEEQRQYQQAARAAQTARGNIFGVAPAVEEAVTTGAAGEQRKLARYGAAAQFLGSGQTTSDALKADIAFRDALLQNRLGAASGFIAGGPSLYNLGQARTGAQQSAFQNYIQANQALPGQFGQAPSTAQPFYQAVDQGIPAQLTSTFANLYGSQANYLANTYGAQVGAISRSYTSPSQAFGNVASGLGSLFSFSKAF